MDTALIQLKNLPHYLICSVFFASLIVILSDNFNFFEAFDALTLAALDNSKQPNYGVALSPKLIKTEKNTYALTQVLINNADFESDSFKQISPLNQNTLVARIQDIHNKLNPSILAIDLDLSPTYIERTHLIECEQCHFPLERVLKNTPENANVILITPKKIKSNLSMLKGKLEWMERLCRKNNIEFALPDIHSFLGVVSKYESTNQVGPYSTIKRGEQYCSLGQQVAKTAQKLGRNDPPCRSVCSLFEVRPEEKIAAKIEAIRLVRDLFIEEKSTRLQFKPIDFGFIRRNEIETYDSRMLSPPIYNSDENIIQISFFGGAYGDGDFYKTSSGQTAGVTVHAGVFYSMIKDVGQVGSETDKLLGYLLDIICGVIIAVLFDFVRAFYNLTLKSKAVITALEPLVLSLYFTLPFILLYLLLLLSGWVLQEYHLWTHPHLIALAVFLECYFERATRPSLYKVGFNPSIFLTKEKKSLTKHYLPKVIGRSEPSESELNAVYPIGSASFQIESYPLLIRALIWAIIYFTTVIWAWLIIIFNSTENIIQWL